MSFLSWSRSLIVPAMLLGAGPVAADNLCDAVLTTRSFDVFNTTTTDNIASKATDDVCNTKWSSKDDFEGRVRKWDSTFKYADIFQGTGNADASTTSRTVDQDYQQFCQNNNRSFLRSFFTTSRRQIASTAVNAWEQCIKATQETGLFSRAIIAENRTLITIAVRFKPSGIGDQLRLVGYDNSRYSCSLLGKDVKNITLTKEGLGNSVDISCSPKDSSSELHIAINTSQNQTIGPFVIPSKAYLDLEQQIVALGSRDDDLVTLLAANKVALTQTRAQVDALLPKIGSFVQGAIISFDAMGVPGITGTQNWKSCPANQFLVGMNPYMEDNHLKLVLSCQSLPVLKLP